MRHWRHWIPLLLLLALVVACGSCRDISDPGTPSPTASPDDTSQDPDSPLITLPEIELPDDFEL